MNPKSHKDFFIEVAKDVGVHKDLVNDFVAFYYARVRKNLSDLKNPRIFIPNLGTFTIRKIKLEKAIKRNKDILGNLEKMTYHGFDKHVPVKKKIEMLENMLDMVNQNLDRRKQFKDENK